MTGYAACIVNHRSYADLARALDALARQTHAPDAVWVVDADPDPGARDRIAQQHPGVHWEPIPNRGFAGGANLGIRRCFESAPDAAFVLVMNPDVELDPDHAERLIGAVVAEPRAALAGGKLLRPDRRHIDSAGIRMTANRRPRDRGSEQLDRGQYERAEFVFAISGAALLVRRAAIPDLELEGELFDEDFFLYFEDTDLGWRAGLLGWRCLYVPEACAVHGRGWKKQARHRIPVQVRRHSFKNHYLQIVKNDRRRDLIRDLPVLAVWELARLGFAVLRDRGILAGYRDAWRLVPRARHKRQLLREKRQLLQERQRQRAALASPPG